MNYKHLGSSNRFLSFFFHFLAHRTFVSPLKNRKSGNQRTRDVIVEWTRDRGQRAASAVPHCQTSSTTSRWLSYWLFGHLFQQRSIGEPWIWCVEDGPILPPTRPEFNGRCMMIIIVNISLHKGNQLSLKSCSKINPQNVQFTISLIKRNDFLKIQLHLTEEKG